MRDQFCSDLLLAMNRAAPMADSCICISMVFIGACMTSTNARQRFRRVLLRRRQFGYDVVRNTQGYFELVSGDTNAWTSMMALVNGGLSDNAQYEQLRQYLDVDSFIDYIILNHYVGNTDWANHNWYAFRKRAPGAGYSS